MKIEPARIHWRCDHAERLVPVASDFDDVYFSVDNGLDESRYVFLQGNDLPARFAECQGGAKQYFVIAEIGFGTGLNFLATAKLWLETAPNQQALCPCLHYVAFEKHPLSPDDLARALSVWTDQEPGLAGIAHSLLTHYPMLVAGCHRLHFLAPHNNQVGIVLDLWFGDALANLKKMAIGVDAWYLDGFAPAKNSALWSDALFDEIVRLSDSGTTLATFSAAGSVRRELLRIGAMPTKVKGYGKKREMLIARFVMPHKPTDQSDNKTDHDKRAPITHATVIGAGVAGLCSAYALAQRGIKVILLDKDEPLAGASGNPRALITPKLPTPSDDDAIADNLSLAGFLYACRFYRMLDARYQQTLALDAQVFEQTGVVDLMLPSQKSHDKLRSIIDAYPDELICTSADVQQGERYQGEQADLADHTIAAWVATGGLVNPHALARAVLAHPNIDHAKYKVADMPSFIAEHNDPSHALIVCAGFESHQLDSKIFDCRKIRGQVSWLARSNKATPNLPPIKYDGYAVQVADQLMLGASFVRNVTDTTVMDAEHRQNLAKLCQALPNLAKHFGIDATGSDAMRDVARRMLGRASIRAQTPDYHPIVGHLQGNVYVLTALGSKGFSLAPLCAELLATVICDPKLPIPMSMRLAGKLSWARDRLQTPLDAD